MSNNNKSNSSNKVGGSNKLNLQNVCCNLCLGICSPVLHFTLLFAVAATLAYICTLNDIIPKYYSFPILRAVTLVGHLKGIYSSHSTFRFPRITVQLYMFFEIGNI